MDNEQDYQVRKFKRFDSENEIKYSFVYELDTDIQYQRIGNADEAGEKYRAKSRNISSKGMCLNSPHVLNKGDQLLLEIILPGLSSGIMMEGQVCWAKERQDNEDDDFKFEAGIEISTVKGKPVDETVYFDQEYHVYWSLVLEEVLGAYKQFVYDKKNTKDIL